MIYMVKDLCKIHVMFTGVWRANGVMRASYPDDDYGNPFKKSCVVIINVL